MATDSPRPVPANGGDAPDANEPTTRLERWQKRYEVVSGIASPARLGLAIALVVLVVVGLTGGWEAAAEGQEDEVPVVALAEPVTATPFEVTITKARQGAELKPAAYPKPGKRYLLVVADVTNRHSESVYGSILTQAVHLEAEGLAELRPGTPQKPTLYRVEDGLLARAFSPGVRVPVVLIWEQDEAVPAPEELTVVLDSQTLRRSNVQDSIEWLDAEATARVTVPVTPLKGA